MIAPCFVGEGLVSRETSVLVDIRMVWFFFRIGMGECSSLLQVVSIGKVVELFRDKSTNFSVENVSISRVYTHGWFLGKSGIQRSV